MINSTLHHQHPSKHFTSLSETASTVTSTTFSCWYAWSSMRHNIYAYMHMYTIRQVQSHLHPAETWPALWHDQYIQWGSPSPEDQVFHCDLSFQLWVFFLSMPPPTPTATCCKGGIGFTVTSSNLMWRWIGRLVKINKTMADVVFDRSLQGRAPCFKRSIVACSDYHTMVVLKTISQIIIEQEHKVHK